MYKSANFRRAGRDYRVVVPESTASMREGDDSGGAQGVSIAIWENAAPI